MLHTFMFFGMSRAHCLSTLRHRKPHLLLSLSPSNTCIYTKCIREAYNNRFVKEKLVPIDLNIANVLCTFIVAIWFYTIPLLGSPSIQYIGNIFWPFAIYESCIYDINEHATALYKAWHTLSHLN